MTLPVTERFSDTQRMELRSYVELAGEVIAQYWPMRTFIHHNPLHGLESSPFQQAVQRGRLLFGGRGYLSNEEYRRHLEDGRIEPRDVRKALEPLALDKRITFAGRFLSHLDVLAASMIHGVAEDGATGPETNEVATVVQRVGGWLHTLAEQDSSGSGVPPFSLNRDEPPALEPLSTWCDRTFGTTVVNTINREMVKWCSAFLDEGEASWAMPQREQTFYRAWKALAQHDLTLRLLGIRDAAAIIRALPHRTEDAVLDSLTGMRIPKTVWEQYFSLHLVALPGWTGYIKWRAHEQDNPWQQSFPIDLVKYLAVRLFYERHLVEAACRLHLGIAGHHEALQDYMEHHAFGYRLRRAWVAGQVPASMRDEVRQLGRKDSHDYDAWDEIGRRFHALHLQQDAEARLHSTARSLVRLAAALSIQQSAIESTLPSDVCTLIGWLNGFPASQHGPIWLKAFEATHRRQILREITSGGTAEEAHATEEDVSSRPLAQVVFCIDVRSEVFRRHLEHLGGHETLGLAGFFGVPVDYQPFSGAHTVAHCPVLLRPKNQVREIPRSYHGALAERHKTAAQLSHAAHTLLHDLKENVATPYVMVEALGWLFSVPLFGRTLLPRWYQSIVRRVKDWLVPSVATTLTVDKITRNEAEDMVATEQQAVIRELIRGRFGLSGAAFSSALLEKIRRNAMGQADETTGDVGKLLGLTPESEQAFYEELRERYRISPRGISLRLERITQTGFSAGEQAYFVEAALRLMGLTSNFARLVVFCAHGSTSQNNPYESALDCGACGGNHGLPNARTIAAMANRTAVRDLLKGRGITIPADTQFLAAEHDTTADRVRVVDLEDLPATHRKDLQRLLADLEEAGTQTALERSRCLERRTDLIEATAARRALQRRSEDWAEVRPEWGLSKNSVIIIARRALTQRVNLRGRSFLHSYDHRQDSSGKLLETIMTAPLVVAQWINMEHYFSTVDNEVYGSGSKVYHNVVGRVGVMTGVWSDLRIGLPAQTVFNGPVPYHEPMRLLAVIEAPPKRIQSIINRHPLLEQLFNLEWVTLLALDPQDKQFYRYDGSTEWKREESGGHDHDRTHIASNEGNQDHCAGGSIEVCH
ncbi:MAG TPA: DUF2309 domain-containing protein [Nitrospiraceae bacterium]|nr:DUF2309 domain-containing protein [Nitrospiraceae bacterium]